MNPNHSNFAARDESSPEFPSSGKGSPRDAVFLNRIRAFEQCCTSGSAGVTNLLRVTAGDLFRKIPLVECEAADELRQAFENPFEQKRPALRRYIRTLQVLRNVLATSVALETQMQPGAMASQLQETKQDQS